MSLITDRGGAGPRTRHPRPRRHGGPVVLATFGSARFEADASRVAVEAAADMQAPLVIAQVLGVGRRRRRTDEPLPAALAATVRAAREHAGDVGVEVEALRVTGRRPVASLLGFVADRRPALVVLASDPAALRPRPPPDPPALPAVRRRARRARHVPHVDRAGAGRRRGRGLSREVRARAARRARARSRASPCPAR